MLQPLWIVLLPFTLLNVAGWMHQPLDDHRKPTRSWRAVRGLLRLIAYLLTALYAAWSGVLVIDVLLVQWRLGGQLTYPALAGVAVATVAVLFALFRIARHVQGGYEGMQQREGLVDASEHLDEAESRDRFGGERDLTAASFWLHAPSARWMLIRHICVAGLVVLVPVALGCRARALRYRDRCDIAGL